MKILFFLIFPLLPLTAFALPQMRGLRVDPAYFYHLYSEWSVEEIASKVVASAKEANVNTLYLYAYSPVHGAYYKTSYPLAEIETDLGSKEIFKEIAQQAWQQNMKVIAVIPINDFKSVWDERSDWRSKKVNGEDYQPFTRSHILSVWHPEFRNWYAGFVDDLIKKFPQLYAVEAMEPTIDCLWTGEPDYNAAAVADFKNRFPNTALGGPEWLVHRGQGMTELIGIMSEIAHRNKIFSAVVQTWPAEENGEMMSSNDIRDHVGIDFDGILNLQNEQKVDLLIGEFLWQQWSAEYGSTIFTPAWTEKITHDFINFVGERSQPVVHVEISPWHGKTSLVTPTIEEFAHTLDVIKNITTAIDVYDYSQMETRDAWDALSRWTDQGEMSTDHTKASE